MIAVDTNAIVYLTLQGEKTSLAQVAAQLDPDWITVPLWSDEYLNVLVASVKAGHLGQKDALAAWTRAQEAMAGRERAVDAPGVLDLALRHGITAYDAQFVHLAQRQDVRLITEDRELLKKFPKTAISLAAFVANR